MINIHKNSSHNGRSKRGSILTAALLVLFAACQNNTYRISGSGEALADGDTLFLTTDLIEGTPTDTIVISEGKFQLKGETDSVQLAMIYKAQQPEINVPFFLEPGHTELRFSLTPGNSRIARGGDINTEWQRMNDSIMVVGREINRIAEHIYAAGDNATAEEQQRQMERIDELNGRFRTIVLAFAHKNIGNELGYFILNYYPDEVIDYAERLKLIEMLPELIRQRPAIQEMERELRPLVQQSNEPIADFTMETPEGKTLSLLAEVKQHELTIIDFWASWCGPCREEMPLMVRLYHDYKDRGLGIVGISLDSDRAEWQEAIRQLGITWPQMSDLKSWDNAAARHFGINSIPHTIVVDKDGHILEKGLRGAKLQLFVEAKLKK
ncbi:MAG: AhpC/TSA family protein [Prevotella sp.]|nr:AhpC/TSA family protein [Prevotella sp.]